MKFCTPSTLRKVIVHADDFGIGKGQSQRILDCARTVAGTAAGVAGNGARVAASVAGNGARVAASAAGSGARAAASVVGGGARVAANAAGGALNSLSVLVTSPRYRECVKLLAPYRLTGDLSVGLHVNLVEGHCAADASHIPLLVDDEGVFKRGFIGLLLMSAVRPRMSRVQLAEEVGAQIDLFLEEFPDLKERLRIDSHQHFHLIPAVFDALVSAVETRDCTVEYIRVPAEPLLPHLRARTLHLVAPVNWVKCGVLNALWLLDKRKVPEIMRHSAVFCGVCFSGAMTAEHVNRIARSFKEYAAAKHLPVEFLFHPGGVESAAECLNPALPGFVAFYTSPNRSAEAEAVRLLAI